MSIRAYSHPVALTAILVLAVAAGAQEEQWLRYRWAREASQIAGGLNTVQVELIGETPAGVALPEFTGETPFFGKWPTPMPTSGTLWIALDRTGQSLLPNSLYIDSNGNGRLDDETGTTACRTDPYNAYFGPVKILFQVEDGPVTYHLNMRFYRRDASSRRLYVSAGGGYEGDIAVGGRKKHCVLLDYNANGTFNDTSPDAGQCDRIGISQGNTPETLFVGKYLEVDGTLYQPEIARNGAQPQVPRLNIRNKDGTYDRTFSFSYG